ncbi:hypothetical protein [Pseudonocardia humida]|uniref:C2H2-type domain-containing protein n=1 Tax=Pseudonocardia humida TaxID=2800819 RepID=A0ABT0ZVR7_9PSEU|nr:hypothetical protein [Pseudonocardia humida]MCO1654840.1 hypothetical protein [Pseudonocardia humida]
MRIPFRRRTTAAESRPLPVPAPVDAVAAEVLARARVQAGRNRWDELTPARRAEATREAWRWMLAAREAGFTLIAPVPPTPPGYTAVPADLASTDAVDPAQLVSCGTCGCVITRGDRGKHARFHASTGAPDRITAPSG